MPANTTREDDEMLLHMLDLRDGEGMSAAGIARKLGMTKSTAIARLWRVDNAMDPARVCDGTMPRGWWRA